MSSRRLRFAAAISLVAAPLLASALPAPASAAAGSGLVNYSLSADAPGLGITGLYMGVALTVPETTSTLATGGVGAGLASLAWPGDIGGNLGTTILVLSPTAPKQVTLLNDPVKAETRSGGTQHATNKTVPGTVMSSTATGSRSTASSQTGPTLPIGGVGGFSGSSRVQLTGAARAIATARSTVSDLALAGGAIKIGAVTSTATATTNGKHATATGTTTIGGASIAGIPVTIDGSGIHLDTAKIPIPAVGKVLDKALSSLGLSATVTSPEVTEKGGAASFDAGSLVLAYHRGSKDYAVTLGRASVSVSATAGYRGGAVAPVTPTTAPTSAGHSAPPQATASTGVSSGGVSLPPVDTASRMPPALGRAPALPQRVVRQVAAIALAGGPGAALVVGLLALVALAGVLLPMVPARILPAAGADDEVCEEQDS